MIGEIGRYDALLVGDADKLDADSPLEGTGFEPSVPPRKRQPSREAPRPTIVVSRDYLLKNPIQLIGPASLVRNSRETFHKSGTDVSNPVPSGGESGEICSSWL